MGCVILISMAGCLGPSEEYHSAYRSIPHEFLRAGEGGSHGRPAARALQSPELPDVPSMPLVDENDELTPAHAVRVALRDNPDIHAALARVDAAQARILQAQAAYWPIISFGHQAARTFHTPASRNRLALGLQGVQQIPAITPPSNTSGLLDITTLLNALRRPLTGGARYQGDRNSFSEYSTSLTISWTLYDGLAREARLRAGRRLGEAAEAGREDVRRLLTQAVLIAYAQAQLGEEQLRIAVADETFSREQLDMTRQMHEARKVGQADVGNFELRQTAAQANVALATGLRDTARVVLAELMGVSGEWPGEMKLSPLADETEEELTPPSVEEWLSLAVRQRPDLRQLTAIVQAEEANIAAAKALYQPVLTLSGSWGFDRSSNLEYSVEDQSSAAALELRWDLFTAGMRRQKVLEASAIHREAVAELKRRMLAVQAQVRSAIIDVEVAQRQIALERRALEISLENRRIVQQGYQAGKESLTRLNETQRDCVTADAELALARIRLRQAWANLRAAAGKEPFGETSDPSAAPGSP